MSASQGPAAGSVVVGIDGSAGAASAALWAAAEADLRGHPLRIVHAAGTDTRALYSSGVPPRGPAGHGWRAPHVLTPALGRVTHAVLHHAHCPVELIPRGDEQGTAET